MADPMRPRPRGSGGALLLGLGSLALGAGALFAFTRSGPAPAQLPDPNGNTGIVPPHLQPKPPAGELPGDPTVEQVLRATIAYNAAIREWRAYLQDLAAGAHLQAEQLAENKKLLGQVQSAAGIVASTASAVAQGAAALGTAANAVPIVGQVVAAVAMVIAFVAQWINIFGQPQGLLRSEIERGVRIRVRPPEITGWERGTYFFQDAPVFGPKVEEFADRLLAEVKEGVWAAQWGAFLAMATAWPYGPPVPSVRVTSDGMYQYLYNLLGNNDLSQEAQQRNEVLQATTNDPREIGPKGARADQEKKRSWYFRPGEDQVGRYTAGYEAGQRGIQPRPGFSESDADYYYQLGLNDGTNGVPALWKPILPAAQWRPPEDKVAEYWRGLAIGASGQQPRAGFAVSDEDYYLQLGISDAARGLPPLWPLKPPASRPLPFVDAKKGGL